MKISKRGLALVGCLVVLSVFLLRESRILWGVPTFDMFDLSRYGVPYNECEYEWTNGLGTGVAVALFFHVVRRSPKVSLSRSESERPVSDNSSPSSTTRRDKISNPFELVESRWKKVDLDAKEEEAK
ncbi:MAG: hypothetical protein JSW58_11840 [Candidatus Latescibacterota bacterium]|nr:MAG: hypothetical protein JSW58_11840 [Candidatus Latescibacterota bacterium]